jgi:putative membrane protein
MIVSMHDLAPAADVGRDRLRLHLILLATGALYLIWSGLFPRERFTWFAETAPAMIGGIILIATYRRFPLTTVNYVLIWLFALILMTGGHWTYAQVPIGNWAREAFGLSRNHFDRVGHVMQGVIPAMLARELLLRTSSLQRGKWLFFACVCMALSVSAAYEIFEWQYAVAFGGQRADDFLGSQGDIWDAQKDMLMALIGAVISLLLLSRLQDRQLRQMQALPHEETRTNTTKQEAPL